jgi:hypothetical protein
VPSVINSIEPVNDAQAQKTHEVMKERRPGFAGALAGAGFGGAAAGLGGAVAVAGLTLVVASDMTKLLDFR